MPAYQITQIFCYTQNEKIPINHKKSDTCEDVCIKLCTQLNLKPLVQLLFGLRERSNQKGWIPPCRHLDPSVEYVFRLRFKVNCTLIFIDPPYINNV